MDPEAVVTGERDGEPVSVRARTLLGRALEHATEQREHVGSIPGAHRLPVPELDDWSCGDALESASA
jgi:hypothetical protein